MDMCSVDRWDLVRFYFEFGRFEFRRVWEDMCWIVIVNLSVGGDFV